MDRITIHQSSYIFSNSNQRYWNFYKLFLNSTLCATIFPKDRIAYVQNNKEKEAISINWQATFTQEEQGGSGADSGGARASAPPLELWGSGQRGGGTI